MDIELGELISKNVSNFIKRNSIKPNLIATHGHTVLHNPAEKITLQIGNPLIISTHTGIRVISNFRELDVLTGGQGAPLVPYGDKYLFGENDYCVNIGGIANVSDLKSKKLKDGMYSEVNIPLGNIDDSFSLSRSLLINDSFIYYIKDNMTIGIFNVNPIFYDDETVIVKGLENGMNILKTYIPGVYDGMKVKIVN